MKSFAACICLLMSLTCTALAQQRSIAEDPPRAHGQGDSASPVARWLDLQTLNLAARYRRVETSAKVVAADELQDGFGVRGRFKFDAPGRFSLIVGAATGRAVTSGWNSTGIGSGTLSNAFSVKQAYAAAMPLPGLNIEYGGLSAVRGETTEVTNLDNDAYVVGGRVTVQRPDTIWLDEATVSLIYLGDPLTPNVFSRLHRLSEINYRQYLVGKKVGKALGVSVGYDRYRTVGTIRAGVALRSPRLHAIDVARFEHYSRLGDGGASGFGVYAEKRLLSRVVVAGGYAAIDAENEIPNGDRYLSGRRLYTLDTVRLTRDMSISLYFTHTVATEFAVANRTRFETVVTYNALRAVRQALGLR